MRLVTFEREREAGVEARVGVLAPDGGVIDVVAARAAWLEARGRPDPGRAAREELGEDMLGLLQRGDRALEAVREAMVHVEDAGISTYDASIVRYQPQGARLLAPLPRPNSLRDFMVVEEHVRRSFKGELPAEWWNLPVYYKGNCDEVYGPGDVVPWPEYTEKLDYELEICAVVGRIGRNVPERRAHQMIVGYTIFNDWSARDIQFREMSVGIGPGYGKDFANSFGPALLTAEDWDRDTARLAARIDGETWSQGTLGTMRFSFEEIIAWVSREQTLRPGDLLGSGTVGGGCGLELDRWISPGSKVELEAEGIGTLANVVGHRGEGPQPPHRPLATEGVRR